MKVRLRYAPSPTGLQHIGSVRTALFNYFFARAKKGSFILRIEDTDQKRLHPDAVADIHETFRWLGISYDEGPEVGGSYGPYVQSARRDIYTTHIQRLLSLGAAYESEEEKDGTTSTVVRLKIPRRGKVSFQDVLLGNISYALQDIPHDPVLIKSDGNPTYHFANVVDDHLMCISHVLRSQEWVPSTPIHVLLYQYFGWDPPMFCHLPMVLGSDGQKLSKRFGALSLRQFREEGYLPEALLNCIMLLGWSYDDRQQIFDRKMLERHFSLDGLNKAASIFDRKKLDWFNGSHIRLLEDASLMDLLGPYLSAVDLTLSDDRWAVLIPLLKPRLTKLSDVVMLLSPLCQSPDFSKVAPCLYPELLATILAYLLQHWEEDEEALSTQIKQLAAESQLSVGACFMELRKAVAGSKVSLPIIPLCKVLGKDEVAQRIMAYRSGYES